jgi:hypothetical protein
MKGIEVAEVETQRIIFRVGSATAVVVVDGKKQEAK